MKKIYVCTNRDGTSETIRKAKEYCAFVAKKCGAIPIAPHIYFTQFLDDIPEEKAFKALAALQLLSECDELWYFGDHISKGMVQEIVAAKEQNIRVRYVSENEIKDLTSGKGGIKYVQL